MAQPIDDGIDASLVDVAVADKQVIGSLLKRYWDHRRFELVSIGCFERVDHGSKFVKLSSLAPRDPSNEAACLRQDE